MAMDHGPVDVRRGAFRQRATTRQEDDGPAAGAGEDGWLRLPPAGLVAPDGLDDSRVLATGVPFPPSFEAFSFVPPSFVRPSFVPPSFLPPSFGPLSVDPSLAAASADADDSRLDADERLSV